MDFLVFRLYGAIASWGEAAVGSDRPSATAPSRSAILGLIGAAMGIRRDDAERLTALQESVSIGVKQYRRGTLLRDYHTAQVPSQDKKRRRFTRKDELSQSDLNTVLSSRDYRAEGMWTVAIWLASGSGHTLENIRNHLQRPVFALSLGRKSCPLAAPLSPILIEGADLKSALDTSFPPVLSDERLDRIWLPAESIVTYFWQGERVLMPLSEDMAARVQTLSRWDEPLDRKRWQFGPRFEHQLSLREER